MLYEDRHVSWIFTYLILWQNKSSLLYFVKCKHFHFIAYLRDNVLRFVMNSKTNGQLTLCSGCTTDN